MQAVACGRGERVRARSKAQRQPPLNPILGKEGIEGRLGCGPKPRWAYKRMKREGTKKA
jgi:hypothetical protein